eukprot:11854212-Ditylum_brightwellii.AAC.1
MKSLLVLPIEGMSKNAIMQGVQIEGMMTTVGEYIMAHSGITGLERTRQIEEIGKWFILYQAEVKDTVDNLIDDTLPTIFTSQINKVNKIPGYRTPRRANARLTTTTSYTETLKNMLQEKNNTKDKTNFDKIRNNIKKTRTVALSMDDFPALRSNKKQNKMTTGETIMTTSTNTSSVSTVMSDHIHAIDAKISNMQNQGRTPKEEIKSMKNSI